MNKLLGKLGIFVMLLIGKTDEIALIRRDSCITRHGTSVVIGSKRNAIVLFLYGKINRLIYNTSKWIKRLRSHFDGKYTLADRNTPAKQLFRWSYGDDFDSYSEFAIMWASRYTRGELANLLAYEWEGGCSCSYDCCGHWLTNVWGYKFQKFGPIHVAFFGHARNV